MDYEVGRFTSEEVARIRSDPVFFGKTLLEWEAHDAQKIFLSSKARIKVGAWGRQSGKSTCMAVDVLHRALFRPGYQQQIVSLTQDQALIIFDLIAGFAQNFSIVSEQVSKIKYTPFPVIFFKNGSTVRAYSTAHDGKYLRGRTVHRFVVDEAAFIADTILDEAIRPMLARYKGDLVLISTPYGRNYFYREFERGWNNPSDQIRSFKFTSYDNPHLPREELEQIKASTPDLIFRQEYLAEFVDENAFIFTPALIEQSKINYTPVLVRENDHSYVMGVDFAQTNDYTAITVLDVTDLKTVKVAWFERFNQEHGRLAFDDKNYWDAAIGRIRAIARIYSPYRIMVDSTSAEFLLEEMLPTLPQTEGFKFSNNPENPRKHLLINNLVLGFQQQRTKIPETYAVLFDELKYFAYKKTEKGNLQMQASAGRHDDTVISLALAWSAVPPLEGGKVDVIGVERPDVHDQRAKDAQSESFYIIGGQELLPSKDTKRPFDDSNFGHWRYW